MNLPIEKISEILINEQGILCIKPQNRYFDKIYRSAMGVHWDKEKNYLYHTFPTEWNVLQWYKQIVSAVKNEYGIKLKISLGTTFENMDSNIISAIKKID